MRRRTLVLLAGLLLLLLSFSFGLLWSGVLPVDLDSSQRSHWWDPFLLASDTLGTQVVNSFCDSTVSGKLLVADDRGRVCSRYVLDSVTGCCNASQAGTSTLSCNTCGRSSRCCRVYEYCVTCCMRQDFLPDLELLLTPAPHETKDFNGLAARFSACSALCRTSSESVEHERSYKSSAMFCFAV